VNPARAEALHAKLLALADPARGGTTHERAVAKQKADMLAARYGLAPPSRTARPRRRTPRFTAPAAGEAWFFKPATGEHHGAVKVLSYTDRGNWRIEIDVPPPRLAGRRRNLDDSTAAHDLDSPRDDRAR
jgi:hypothetical protein